MPTIRYDLEGDASGLIRDIKSLSAVLDKSGVAADKAGSKIAGMAQKASVASKAVDTKGAGLGSKMEGLKKAADGAGGKVGEVAGRLQNLAEAAKALASPMGAAILGFGAMSVGIVAVGAAAINAIVNVDEFVKQLEAVGQTPIIGEDGVLRLQDTNEQFKELKAAATQLALVLADELNPEINSTASGLTRIVKASAFAAQGLGEYVDVTKEIIGNQVAAQLGPLGTAFKIIAVDSGLAAKGVDKLTEAFDEATEKTPIFGPYLTDLELIAIKLKNREEAEKAAAKAIKETERAQDEATSQALAGFKRGQEIQKQIIAGIESERAAREQLASDTVKGFENAKKLGEQRVIDEKKQAEERRSINAQYVQDTREWSAAVANAWADAAGQAADSFATAFSVIGDDRREDLRKTKEAIKDREDFEGIKSKQRGRALRAQRKEQREGLLRAFVLQKAAALASIAINTAQAIGNALFWAGPAYPVVIGTLAAAGATQAAVVAAQKPSFHLGTDEVAATLRQGEAVLTPSAADAVGRETIRELNAGSQAGGAQTVTIQFVWKGEVIDQMVADVMADGGAIAREVSKLARVGLGGPYGGR